MRSRGRATDQVVRDVITEILPDLHPSEITLRQDLQTLGADSVDRVEIISLLLHRLGRNDAISDFATIADIGELINYLDRGSTG